MRIEDQGEDQGEDRTVNTLKVFANSIERRGRRAAEVGAVVGAYPCAIPASLLIDIPLVSLVFYIGAVAGAISGAITGGVVGTIFSPFKGLSDALTRTVKDGTASSKCIKKLRDLEDSSDIEKKKALISEVSELLEGLSVKSESSRQLKEQLGGFGDLNESDKAAKKLEALNDYMDNDKNYGKATHENIVDLIVMPPISQAANKGELLACSNHCFSNTHGGL